MESPIQFDIRNDAQIKSMFVFKNTTDGTIVLDMYDTIGYGTCGTCGSCCSCVIEIRIPCETCGLNSTECDGHYDDKQD